MRVTLCVALSPKGVHDIMNNSEGVSVSGGTLFWCFEEYLPLICL